MKSFDSNNIQLCRQFDSIHWIPTSGVDPETLTQLYHRIMSQESELPKSILKARTFEMILDQSRLAIDPYDIFQDKVYGGDLLQKQRSLWQKSIVDSDPHLKELYQTVTAAKNEYGAFSAESDFGHTSPNSQLLLQIGLPGLLDRIETCLSKKGLTLEQQDFYLSCQICISAMMRFCDKMASYILPYNPENSNALSNIAKQPPKNIYEAMQLLIIYFFLHEYVAGTRVRTLGRLDVLLTPFYEKDLQSGTFSKEEIKEMVKFFFNKFWTAKVPYDLPICLAGIDENGNEVTNELTYLLIETYNELNIYSPKIHIRISQKTPESLIKLVLNCIRNGNSSFVFINDAIAIRSLTSVNIDHKDACNYVPIGCYEPAVWGSEIGCTGNGCLNLAKALEFTITGGADLRTGKQVSLSTGPISSYAEFIQTIYTHIQYMTEMSLHYVRSIEAHYPAIGPDPILSAMYDNSILTGRDVFAGGAKYNNSSFLFCFIATLVDSITAVKRLVFEEQQLTFDALCEILKHDWKGYEKLRLLIKKYPEKYGSGNPVANSIAKEVTEYCASLVNNQPNGRGGIFKAGLFSIDWYVPYGLKTMATPDGRHAGDPLSKNLCASIGMDRNGVTALINSVTQIDHAKFPNGSVLDILLHPSAVSGDDGLNAFYSLLQTYMHKGGFALHGNVMDAQTLRAAQLNPDQYKNLQIRVCGWNAYFVNLSKAEQDQFIRQAEALH